MKNQHGLDCDYFKRKMKILIKDMDNYSPSELSQELDNMKSALDGSNNVKEKTAHKRLYIPKEDLQNHMITSGRTSQSLKCLKSQKNTKKRPSIVIKLISISDIEEVNKLYDNHFDYLSEELLPCYVTIEGFWNNDYSWFNADVSNKDEILKNYTLISIEEAKKVHIETPKLIKVLNEKENQKIDNLFSKQ